MQVSIYRATLLTISCAAMLSPLAVVTQSAQADTLGRRGLMGVQLSPVTPQHVEQLSLESTDGVLIAGVFPDTAAQKAGLETNDIIKSVDGAEVKEFTELLAALRTRHAGDTLKLKVLRGDEVKDFELTLGDRPRETSDDFDIIYDSVGKPGERFRTFVTRPKADGKYPAILFIQSLPPGSMEFSQAGAENHPFKKFIDQMTREGFVTMRVDRKGVGDSDGDDPRAVTLQDDIKAFTAAAKKLGEYDFVDGDSVFIFAHSGGTLWAPMVAKQAHIRGVVTYAAIARPVVDSLVDMSRRSWELEMLPADEIKSRAERLQKMLTACLVEKKDPATIRKENEDLAELTNEMFQQDKYFGGLEYGYYQKLADTDYEGAWRAVDAPVLALFGAADFRANKADSKLVATACGKNGEMVEIPGIDHSFFNADDAEESYLSGQMGGEMNPVIVETVAAWVKKKSAKSDA